jgi:hypothetical protein
MAAALAQHIRVFDGGSLQPTSREDDERPERHSSAEMSCEIAGYMIDARRTDAWDAIVALLIALDADHPVYFNRVMHGCRRLSNSTPEEDGFHDLLTDREQDMFDLSIDREGRREQQGFVAPAQARAFLQMARQSQPGADTTVATNPIAQAYFRSIATPPPADVAVTGDVLRLPGAADLPPAPEDAAAAITAVADLLADAGVTQGQPRRLLEAAQGDAPRTARIQAYLQAACERDDRAGSTRTAELAYLANTLVAGCSIQRRPFTAREAADAVLAVCNLAIENRPGDVPDDFLVAHDLVSVFQAGWTVLHRDVAMFAAERLIETLRDLRSSDRDIQAGLNVLRFEMTKHWRAGAPWLAREALDVIVILDMPAWAALLGLIDECPVMHAAIGAAAGARPRAVSAAAFEFIAGNSQIASIHAFLRTLPDILR